MEMIAGYVHANRLVLPAIISILVVLPLPTLLASTEILSFSFPDPKSLQNTQNLSLTGEASVSPSGIALTNPRNPSSAGWATYHEPLHLWDNATRRVADFASNFSFVIKNVSQVYAEGIAFFLTPSGASMNESQEGWGFALTASTSAIYDGTCPRFIAVEFDTYVHVFDPNYTHVGIDTDTIYSKAVAPWEWNRITAGGKVNAMVVYNSSQRILSVKITDADNASAFSTLSYKNLNMMDYLPEWVTFGFSAATCGVVEINTIQSWNFTSSLEVQDRPSSLGVQDPPYSLGVQDPPKKKKNSNWQWIIISVVSFFFICLVLGFLWWSRRQPKRNGGDVEQTHTTGRVRRVIAGVTTFRRYLLNEMATATNNFSNDLLLGRGGFGMVYKGLLEEGKREVAIKKFIRISSKDWVEGFEAEVKTISQLRHKNLVQLIGWCHENKQLLLVYELMPNGSLDTHLFEGQSLLTWEMRYQIAKGLASALHYLHEEWYGCVLHRDIKASNVLLDADFNATLGDFGLARIVDHAKGYKTTGFAGTLGYMAPESIYPGMVKKESDMYSFGIVMLEIASGKKVIDPTDGDFRLVNWIWGLYGTCRLLEALDPMLNDYDPSQMERLMVVGLWCAHPDSGSRPTISTALSVLKGEASLPNLPPTPPVPTYARPEENESVHPSLASSTLFLST